MNIKIVAIGVVACLMAGGLYVFFTGSDVGEEVTGTLGLTTFDEVLRETISNE